MLRSGRAFRDSEAIEEPNPKDGKENQPNGMQQDQGEGSLLEAAINKITAAGVKKPLPVTVLSGFLGAGKTTLLKRMLQMEHGYKVAVIVNDMADINIDAELVKKSAAVTHTEAKMVEMSNGCICCTLRGDLIEAVADLVASQRYDYLVIESTGVAEPMPVAATFATEDEAGKSLAPYVKVDTMVTVVDGPAFMRDMKSGDSLLERKMEVTSDDERTVTDLLVDQIEFADLIILNKKDLMTDKEATRFVELCKRMNPNARVTQATRCDVPLEELFDTGRFDFEKAQNTEGWNTELKNNHTPETEEYGISSLSFSSVRPFHPQRFWDFNDKALPKNVIRGKGFFWIAGLDAMIFEWTVAGTQKKAGPMGMWESAMMDGPPEKLPDNWHPEYLDRRQQLVLIGERLDKKALEKQLEACLVTDDELAKSKKLQKKWQQVKHNPWIPGLLEAMGDEDEDESGDSSDSGSSDSGSDSASDEDASVGKLSNTRKGSRQNASVGKSSNTRKGSRKKRRSN